MAGCTINGEDKKVKIEVSGNKPTKGSITITNGQVTLTSSMEIEGHYVTYDEENKKYIGKEIYKGILCTKKDGVDLSNLAYGNEFTCELGDDDAKTFYVLETSGDNISLIMNANIDAKGKAITPDNLPDDKGLVAWSSDGNNHRDENESAQAVTAKAYLSSSAASWTKLNQSQIKLPTASQIAIADGKNYADNPTLEQEWLYDYLNGTTNSVSGVYGYWTSSLHAFDVSSARYVFYNGNLNSGSVSRSGNFGIRPVITIPKSQLN